MLAGRILGVAEANEPGFQQARPECAGIAPRRTAPRRAVFIEAMKKARPSPRSNIKASTCAPRPASMGLLSAEAKPFLLVGLRLCGAAARAPTRGREITRGK